MQESKDSEERKDEFINVAEKLFKENGIVDTTVNSIVKDMNVAKGLFYYYFNSKDDVIDAISQKYNEVFNEMMNFDMNQPRYEDRLDHFIRNCVKSFRTLDHDLNGNGKADLSTLLNKSKQEALKVSSSGLAKIIEEGNTTGKLNVPQPKYYAKILIAGINALIEDGEASDDEIAEMIMDLIHRSGKEDENVGKQ
jgi:AcrR family transcriptional regulator